MKHFMDEALVYFNIEFSAALQGCFSKYTFTPTEAIGNEKLCFEYLENDITALLKWYSDGNIFLKRSYSLDATFSRINADGETVFKNAGFSSTDHAFTNAEADKLPEQFNDMRNDIIARIDKYSKEGSGWFCAKLTHSSYTFTVSAWIMVVVTTKNFLPNSC